MNKSDILDYLSELESQLNGIKRCLCSPLSHIEKTGYINLGVACDNLAHLIESLNHDEKEEKDTEKQEEDSEDENTYATIKDVKEFINLIKDRFWYGQRN